MPSMSLQSVTAVIILSVDDGSVGRSYLSLDLAVAIRIFAKYYNAPHHAPTGTSGAPSSPYSDVKSQKSFEKGLLEKTAKQTGDIILYDNKLVLYKMESDVMMYVVGGAEENEVLLYNVILALRDSLHLLFKQSVDKRTVVENYDLVSLAIDEIVDDGIILETDPTIIVQRVSKAPTQDVNLSRIDLSEQGVNNLAQLGRAKLTDWLRQGL
ncbi:snare-like protein [Xylaria bambusicola]|uniref:snare-like protein n=1 Tax=Xylaria bambusicola TaxID=326684 RepID=UPI00200827A2|nr:snare-like protein [Xylaria bambusicola]KAI0523721.1 snare-like protein [Xylaria bambusicola]